MNREQKAAEVKSLAERVERAKALIFAGYRGLKVSDMTELRRKLRQTSAGFKVVKNRLLKRVLSEKGLDQLNAFLNDPTAIATSEGDPVSVAKALVEFAKANEKLVLKGGFVEGRLVTSREIDALAKLPSRDELLARALASMQAPASNLVGVLAAIPRKLLYALNAIKATKQ